MEIAVEKSPDFEAENGRLLVTNEFAHLLFTGSELTYRGIIFHKTKFADEVEMIGYQVQFASKN